MRHQTPIVFASGLILSPQVVLGAPYQVGPFALGAVGMSGIQAPSGAAPAIGTMAFESLLIAFSWSGNPSGSIRILGDAQGSNVQAMPDAAGNVFFNGRSGNITVTIPTPPQYIALLIDFRAGAGALSANGTLIFTTT